MTTASRQRRLAHRARKANGQPRPLAPPAPPSTGWFHGGAAGLAIGCWILPAAEIGDTSRGEIWEKYDAAHELAGTWDPTWVYITNDLDWAIFFACQRLLLNSSRICGQVYEVQPDGRMGIDPDGGPASGWRKVERAKIIRRVEIPHRRLQAFIDFGRKRTHGLGDPVVIGLSVMEELYIWLRMDRLKRAAA